jgi:hypothetical protein
MQFSVLNCRWAEQASEYKKLFGKRKQKEFD